MHRGRPSRASATGETDPAMARVLAMNDFFLGALARERQGDYMREVEHDELAARLHQTQEPPEVSASARARLPIPASHHWNPFVHRPRPVHLHVHLRRRA